MMKRILVSAMVLAAISLSAGFALVVAEATLWAGVPTSTGTTAGWLMVGGVTSGAVAGIFLLLP